MMDAITAATATSIWSTALRLVPTNRLRRQKGGRWRRSLPGSLPRRAHDQMLQQAALPRA